jgi:Ca-activated chloride channel homolog
MNEASPANAFAPVSAHSGKAIQLAMQKLWLVGRVTPFGARLFVRHMFRSGENKPLEVIYSFGLPRDAALRRFRITGEGFSVASELKPVDKAVEEYERGLEEGHTAALARQHGDGVVNLTVGNIRPGEEVTVNLEILAGVESRDDGFRFRFPFTLAPAYHSRARAAEVRPGIGEIELPADEFGDVVLPQFVSDASSLHEVGFDLTAVMMRPIAETASPSHSIKVVNLGADRSRVSLATAKDVPNRDLVLDVRTKESLLGAIGGTGSDGKGHFAAIVTSDAFKAKTEAGSDEPRRIVFVVDRSGSMNGAPIEQARKAVEACLGALGESDAFGLVAFDSHVESFGSGLITATKKNRDEAKAFMAKIDARGGTELAAGVKAAAAMLRDSNLGQGGGDIFIVTDGQVMGTERIIAEVRAEEIRIHCLGIGSASQDRFLSQLARETGGVSRFLTPRERVDMGAVELFAAIGRPLATELEAKVEGFADGSVMPDPPKFAFSGTPIVLFGEASGPGVGRLALAWSGKGGRQTLELPLHIAAGGEGEILRLLRGARLITDLENRLTGSDDREENDMPERRTDRVRRRLAALSESYGLASTQTALVAVVKRSGDKPGDPPVTRVVPVGLAQDVDAEAYFPHTIAMNLASGPSDIECFQSVSVLSKRIMPGRNEFLLSKTEADDRDIDNDAALKRLLELAASLEPDGGMPGKTEEERLQATILALLQFLEAGHSTAHGAFRAHVQRLVDYLEKSKIHTDIVKQIIELGRSGRALPGEWEKRRRGLKLWEEIRIALESL